ncbi:MAG: DUF354 domain-containing protein [Candidatus Thermoplasmatota archaeon]
MRVRNSVGEFTKIAVVLNTPAQVHLFRNIIDGLQKDGHEVLILARRYGDTLELLSEFALDARVFADGDGRKFSKIASVPNHLYGMCKILRPYKPDVVIGSGADSAVVSWLMKASGILFNDSEPIPAQLLVMKLTSDAILTPSCFRADLGKNHVRVDTYKELAYLHPNHFSPDTSILHSIGISPGERYGILRFNGFKAIHDLGITGFSIAEKRRLAETLGQRMRVFVSSETPLPADLEKLAIRLPKSKIHDLIAHASLVVADTQTIVTEAAVLGTPAVRFNGFVGDGDMGNFIELQRKYDMIYSFSNSSDAISKAIQLAEIDDVKREWERKRQVLLRDKVDLTQFMIEFIERYPESKFNALHHGCPENS